MLSFRRSMALLVAAAGVAAGQPALTAIQDILYTADGVRFNGTMFITWSSFQAGDSSNIATANLTVPIVNGVLNVQLVPTTTASAGAQYNVTFNNAGVNQFTQVWAVPPSTVPLNVRAITVSPGTVVGPTTSTPISISDVTGLENELTIRPQQGVDFAPGRAAIINSSGQIDGASGNLTNCVRAPAGPDRDPEASCRATPIRRSLRERSMDRIRRSRWSTRRRRRRASACTSMVS